MPVCVSERELAIVLAALRCWQRDLAEDDDGPISSEHFDLTITPLTVKDRRTLRTPQFRVGLIVVALF